MGINYEGFAFPKGALRIDEARAKRLDEERQERACRALVDARDHYKCRIPGCKEKSVREQHHLIYMSKSKRLKFSPDNRVSLCRAHHQLLHAGRITITREPDGELIVKGAAKDLRFRL